MRADLFILGSGLAMRYERACPFYKQLLSVGVILCRQFALQADREPCEPGRDKLLGYGQHFRLVLVGRSIQRRDGGATG